MEAEAVNSFQIQIQIPMKTVHSDVSIVIRSLFLLWVCVSNVLFVQSLKKAETNFHLEAGV